MYMYVYVYIYMYIYIYIYIYSVFPFTSAAHVGKFRKRQFCTKLIVEKSFSFLEKENSQAVSQILPDLHPCYLREMFWSFKAKMCMWHIENEFHVIVHR